VPQNDSSENKECYRRQIHVGIGSEFEKGPKCLSYTIHVFRRKCVICLRHWSTNQTSLHRRMTPPWPFKDKWRCGFQDLMQCPDYSVVYHPVSWPAYHGGIHRFSSFPHRLGQSIPKIRLLPLFLGSYAEALESLRTLRGNRKHLVLAI